MDRQRLLKNVTVVGECWEWCKARTAGGYGRFWLGGKMITAHRAAWAIFNGEIPPHLNVLHSCDNRPCCNPNHLFLGTPRDNTQDMISKGRHARKGPAGSLNNKAKLTERKVSEIRTRYRRGNGVSLAREYGVGAKQISRIVTGKMWRAI